MNIGLHAAGRRRPERAVVGVRTLAIALLASIALVPSLSRAHDRLHRSPADEYSRFRWTNSCESVPQKITTVVVAAPVESAVQSAVAVPARLWERVAPTVPPHPVGSAFRPLLPLRAPPLT